MARLDPIREALTDLGARLPCVLADPFTFRAPQEVLELDAAEALAYIWPKLPPRPLPIRWKVVDARKIREALETCERAMAARESARQKAIVALAQSYQCEEGWVGAWPKYMGELNTALVRVERRARLSGLQRVIAADPRFRAAWRAVARRLAATRKSRLPRGGRPRKATDELGHAVAFWSAWISEFREHLRDLKRSMRKEKPPPGIVSYKTTATHFASMMLAMFALQFEVSVEGRERAVADFLMAPRIRDRGVAVRVVAMLYGISQKQVNRYCPPVPRQDKTQSDF